MNRVISNEPISPTNQGRPFTLHDVVREVAPSDSRSTNSRFKQWEWNFKNIAFFIISVIILAFAITGAFVSKADGESADTRPIARSGRGHHLSKYALTFA